jgi:hypothetical protein
MSKLVLIENLSPTQANMIMESSKDGKNAYLSGIFMQAELENGNGRKYPRVEIENAVNDAMKRIKEGQTICGELNHPDNLQINLERVSHVITEMKMDGNNAVGKAKLLNTPLGNLVRNLVEGGVRLGVSSRGSGDVNEGTVSGFQFVTMDVVSTPSAPDAYPNLVTEAQGEKKIMSLAEAVCEDPKAQAHLTKAILDFIQALKA